jgi:hypothetical protein
MVKPNVVPISYYKEKKNYKRTLNEALHEIKKLSEEFCGLCESEKDCDCCTCEEFPCVDHDCECRVCHK